MSISTSTARGTSFASEQVTAFFLAQEGIEIVQKVRDDELLDQNLSPSAWEDVMDEDGPLDLCYTNDSDPGCGLELRTDSDATLDTITRCDNTDCLLYYSEIGGRAKYTHSPAGSASSTIFSRVITMENITNDETYVKSTVYWRTGSQRAVQEVVVETYLYDIYGN